MTHPLPPRSAFPVPLACAALLLAALPAQAHGTHAHKPAPAAAATVLLPEEELPDGADAVEDQDGRSMPFREALGDGTFLLSFSFTRCEQQCPLSDLVVDDIAARTGLSGVRLVTLTLDPLHDDAATLKEKSLSHAAGNRLWLTGDPAGIGRLLRRFGMMAGSPERHDVVFVVGNVALGRMTRTPPTDEPPATAELLSLIGSYQARGAR